jgi:hypothetical protein
MSIIRLIISVLLSVAIAQDIWLLVAGFFGDKNDEAQSARGTRTSSPGAGRSRQPHLARNSCENRN